MAAAKKAGAKKAAAKKGGAAKKGAAAKKGGATKTAAKKSSGGGATKSAAKKSSGGGAAKKAAKRAPNPAFMKAMTPSADLAAVVGNKPMPRTEVTKKLWEYIRKNNLQDQKNRRQINADEKLEKIFGKKSVSMFEMNKHLSRHLTAKKG